MFCFIKKLIIFILYSHQAQPTQSCLQTQTKLSHTLLHLDIRANILFCILIQKYKSQMSYNRVINAKNINFCCGPCCSVDPEPKPINHGNEPYHFYKPHDGHRYAKFVWPCSDGGNVTVTNLRICHGCFSRYNDDDFDDEDLIRDGIIVFEKLKDHMQNQ